MSFAHLTFGHMQTMELLSKLFSVLNMISWNMNVQNFKFMF